MIGQGIAESNIATAHLYCYGAITTKLQLGNYAAMSHLSGAGLQDMIHSLVGDHIKDGKGVDEWIPCSCLQIHQCVIEFVQLTTPKGLLTIHSVAVVSSVRHIGEGEVDVDEQQWLFGWLRAIRNQYLSVDTLGARQCQDHWIYFKIRADPITLTPLLLLFPSPSSPRAFRRHGPAVTPPASLASRKESTPMAMSYPCAAVFPVSGSEGVANAGEEEEVAGVGGEGLEHESQSSFSGPKSVRFEDGFSIDRSKSQTIGFHPSNQNFRTLDNSFNKKLITAIARFCPSTYFGIAI
uniref:p0028E10.24 protein n=1 Tax=Oryza sativa subsp. japonica TaxID=39947 RepID=Q9AS68_ORYSJ|nr:P0028E10.24 [Oryza sativa Japonica Group]